MLTTEEIKLLLKELEQRIEDAKEMTPVTLKDKNIYRGKIMAYREAIELIKKQVGSRL